MSYASSHCRVLRTSTFGYCHRPYGSGRSNQFSSAFKTGSRERWWCRASYGSDIAADYTSSYSPRCSLRSSLKPNRLCRFGCNASRRWVRAYWSRGGPRCNHLCHRSPRCRSGSRRRSRLRAKLSVAGYRSFAPAIRLHPAGGSYLGSGYRCNPRRVCSSIRPPGPSRGPHITTP